VIDPATNPALRDPAAVVDEFLRVIMIPDPDGARRYVSPDLRIRFTGGRAMRAGGRGDLLRTEEVASPGRVDTRSRGWRVLIGNRVAVTGKQRPVSSEAEHGAETAHGTRNRGAVH
jgi:hypothetical protein